MAIMSVLLIACMLSKLSSALRIPVINPYEGIELPVSHNQLTYSLATLGVLSQSNILSITFFLYDFETTQTEQVLITLKDSSQNTIAEFLKCRDSLSMRWYIDRSQTYPGQSYSAFSVTASIPYSPNQWHFISITLSKLNHFIKLTQTSKANTYPFRISTASELVTFHLPMSPDYSLIFQNSISESPSTVLSSMNLYDYNICQDSCVDVLYFGFMNRLYINRQFDLIMVENYFMNTPFESVGASKGSFLSIGDKRVYQWNVQDCEKEGDDLIGFYYRQGRNEYTLEIEVDINPDDLKSIEKERTYVKFEEDFEFRYQFEREDTVFCISDFNIISDSKVVLPYSLDKSNLRFDYEIYKMSVSRSSVESRYSFSIYYFGIPNTKKTAQPGVLYTYQLTVINTVVYIIDSTLSFSIIDCTTCTDDTNIITISPTALLTIQNPQSPLQFVIQLNINSKPYYSSVEIQFQDEIPAAKIHHFDRVHSNSEDLFILNIEFEDITYGNDDFGSHRIIVNSELDSEMYLENSLGNEMYFIWLPSFHKTITLDLELWNPANQKAEYIVSLYANQVPIVQDMNSSYKHYSGCLWEFSIQAVDPEADAILYEVHSNLSKNMPVFTQNTLSWYSDGTVQMFSIKVTDDTYEYVDHELLRNEWIQDITLTNDGVSPTVLELFHYCKALEYCVIHLDSKIYLQSSISHIYSSDYSQLNISGMYGYIKLSAVSNININLSLIDTECCHFIRQFSLYMSDELSITAIPTIYYTDVSSIAFPILYSDNVLLSSLYINLLPVSPDYTLNLESTQVSWNKLIEGRYYLRIISSKDETKLIGYLYLYSMITTPVKLSFFSDSDLIVVYSYAYQLNTYTCNIYTVISNTQSSFFPLLYYELISTKGAEVMNMSGVIHWKNPNEDDTLTLVVYNPAHWLVHDRSYILPHNWSASYTFEMKLSYYAVFSNIDPSYFMIYTGDKLEFAVK